MNAKKNSPAQLVRRLSRQSSTLFQSKTRAAGYNITPVQYAALHALAERSGMDQSTLADLIISDRGTIGGVVERLESKGFIIRTTNEADRRAHSLELTQEGRELHDQLVPVVEEIEDLLIARLTEREQHTFLDLLMKTTGIRDVSR